MAPHPLTILSPTEVVSPTSIATPTSAEPTCFAELPSKTKKMAQFWAIGAVVVFAGLLVSSFGLILIGLILIGVGFLFLMAHKKS
jgi:hypothetical protein